MEAGGMEAWHRFLDHTSEVELQVGAADFAGLLAEAGRALAGLILRGAPAVAAGDRRTLEVAAHDREALLVDWLNDIIYLAEVELWVPVEIGVTALEETPTLTRLTARARGAALASAASAVKAATFHGLSIRDLPHGLEAEVILDV
jgi:SHS2 domain-containing protein